jgi:alpha-tubulin suppressor-like RCC1 family protein
MKATNKINVSPKILRKNVRSKINKSTKKFNVKMARVVPGEVFVVGSGDCGQLGLGPELFEKPRPGKLSFF